MIVLQERTQNGTKEEAMRTMLVALNTSIYEQVRKHETKGIEI